MALKSWPLDQNTEPSDSLEYSIKFFQARLLYSNRIYMYLHDIDDISDYMDDISDDIGAVGRSDGPARE